jgi:hypothetical protein
MASISTGDERGGREFGVVVCGGGPAGTGLIVCAAKDGRLQRLLTRGVCVVEQRDRLGAGSLGHYRITGNTRGISFLRGLDTAEPRELFGDVLATAAARALGRRSFVFPPLPLVGSYLERLGAGVEQLLEGHPACAVARRTTVRAVELLAGGGVRVLTESLGSAGATSVVAGRAVIAMGGREPAALETLRLLPRLTLERYRGKLCHASALIDDRIGVARRLVQAVRETQSVVVVGGSHSAWSAAWTLLHDASFRRPGGEPPAITVLHRSALRFYYASAAKARAAGYVFDETRDICPLTGAVHRHGGLRADAHSLARAALAPGRNPSPVRAIRLLDHPDVRRNAERALNGAGLVVAAVGYRPRLPRLSGPDGLPLELATSETGVVVTPRAQLVAANGRVVPELLAYGLGAGLAAEADLAAEPSYTGRVDAVRLYQNEVGRIVLDSLLAEDAAEELTPAAGAGYS